MNAVYKNYLNEALSSIHKGNVYTYATFNSYTLKKSFEHGLIIQ